MSLVFFPKSVDAVDDRCGCFPLNIVAIHILQLLHPFETIFFVGS